MNERPKIVGATILLSLALICAQHLHTVSAGIPVVSNVIVWNDGGNTMLNITVSHSPQSSIHFLNYVEVDVSGVVHTFQVTTRSETTFTISADLGSMNETQTATVRAHCNIDGYSTTLYGPITVPESQATLLTMALMLSLLIGAFAAQLRTLRHLN